MATDTLTLKVALDLQNDRALAALTKDLDRAAKTAKSVSAPMKVATRNTRNFGNIASNVGFQVQDFAVQVQGGVDATRALSQQLPQALVGFGAWGAAIGVVTALLPTFVKLMGDSSKVTESLTDSLTDLESIVSSVGAVTKAIDFTAWNESWNKATQAVKETELALLQFQNNAAATALQDSIDSLFAEQAEATGETWGQKVLDGFYAVIGGGDETTEAARAAKNLAETLGTDQVTAVLVQEQTQLYQQQQINIQQYRDELIKLGATAPVVSDQFRELILNVKSLAEAQEQLQKNREQASAAGTSLVTGQALPTQGTPTQAIENAGEAVKASGVDALIAANDWKQLQEEVKDTEFALQQLYETTQATPEVFSLGNEAVELFAQSFDTMTNGVLAGTQSLEDGITDMVKVILAQLAKLAIYEFLANAFAGTAFGDAAGSLLPSAKGNVFNAGNVVPFASGGVVNGPTVFPMASGMGLMGEAGPEAIVPLTRTSSGNLGVESSPVNVTVNNMAPGVSVNPRQTDSGLTLDIVLNQVSNAIRQGGTSVSNALEESYTLGRGRAVY